jgi:GTPase SAR1 family protein
MTTDKPLTGLLHDEHAELLDVTDGLRRLGLARHMPLPQLVVCGDQSSGKSSVLQSISGVKFPVNDGLCTRFATQVILRRSEQKSGCVSIEPGSSASEEQRQKLKAFNEVDADFENIPVYMEKAKAIMGLAGDSTFSDATLRVELSGPDQPHLTLVDLPGLIHARDSSQTKEDVKIVRDLVRKYISEERTIILAILSAKSDPGTQEILEMAQEFDPTGHRTLGIITKPDTLHPGSPTERKVLSYARNEHTHFGLGWHVVRNADYAEHLDPTYDPQTEEHKLFSKAPWNELPEASLGAKALIARLSECSFELTRAELPNVVQEIDSQIADCRRRLKLLGPPRDSVVAKRGYLIRIADKFQRTVIDGVQGRFGGDKYFANPSRRLCAEVRRLTDAFSDSIRRCGRTYEVRGNGDSASPPIDLDAGQPSLRYAKTDDRPEPIEFGKYMEMIYTEILETSRGRELPTTFDPLLVRDVFRLQSRKWEGIALDYADKAFSAAKNFVEELLQQSTERTTYDKIWDEFLDADLVRRQEVLHEKVRELLTPYTRLDPFSKNPRFVEELKDIELRIHKEYPNWSNQEQAAAMYACKKLGAWEEAYYKFALDTFIDNMATLAIENCVLADLHEMFSPSKLGNIGDDVVERLGSESPKTIRDRASANNDLAVFEKALHICRRCKFGRTTHIGSHVMNPHSAAGNQSPSPDPQLLGAADIASAMKHTSLNPPAVQITAGNVVGEVQGPIGGHVHQKRNEDVVRNDDDHGARPGTSASMASTTSVPGGKHSYTRTPSPFHSPSASLSPGKSISSVSSPGSSPRSGTGRSRVVKLEEEEEL